MAKRKRKTIIEEDEPGTRSHTVVREYNNGWAWLIAILLILAIWGIIGEQITEDTGAECYLGIGDSFCWFWNAEALDNDADAELDIDVDFDNGNNGLYG